MKITVSLKDPDVLSDAIVESVTKDVGLLNLSADEANMLIGARTEKISLAMGKWWEYSEYLNVEFDMDAMTARVIERDK